MIARGSARLEAVLRRAGGDPGFRADLLARRSAAALAAGFELTPAERAILENAGRCAACHLGSGPAMVST